MMSGRGGPPPPDDYGRRDYRGPPRGREGGGRGPPPRGRRYDNDRRGGYRGPPRGGPPRRGRRPEIVFRSYEEEREWVEERRRKRLARPSKFDQEPTPEQEAADAAAAALTNPAATDFAGVPPSQMATLPQQTRHARRLYLGNLPPHVSEEEIHNVVRNAIGQALVGPPLDEDPILSVYINHERRFCFLEFKTVEMTTACMQLDGLEIKEGFPAKIKRPNDYNATMAPKIHPTALPKLDVSRLGIVSGTVVDGPNKIFIGGLHYHLTEQQVLELLQAFGKVKAFHLVKNDADSDMSKGYCFVEYADHSITPVAVQGLNGMAIGGGKSLTARLAGERSAEVLQQQQPSQQAAAAPAPTPVGAPPPGRNIVNGYDVEALVDAAMGERPMPTAPVYFDALGAPLTRIVALVPPAVNPVKLPPAKTRILVLHNMVTDEDLEVDDEYYPLVEEVRVECAKYGTLKDIKVPRQADANVETSAIRKIFLEYADQRDAESAQRELKGRQFGPNVVETSFFPEADFAAGRLR